MREVVRACHIKTWAETSASEHWIFFFSSRLFAAIRSLRAVLLGSFQALGRPLHWPVSRCAKSKAKSINKSRMMRGEAAGVCWVWGELCEEVAEARGLAIEIVPQHEFPSRTLGSPDATLATFWKRTFGTSSNELDDQI